MVPKGSYVTLSEGTEQSCILPILPTPLLVKSPNLPLHHACVLGVKQHHTALLPALLNETHHGTDSAMQFQGVALPL